MTDVEFIARLVSGKGDQSAQWREFLDRYSRLLLNVIWQFEHDHDAAMEKYVHVCERFAANNFEILRRFKADYGERSPKFTTWLAAVARNICIDLHRSVHGRRQLPRSVQRMSEVEQWIFRLYYWKGHTTDEIRELVQARLRTPAEADRLIGKVLHVHERAQPSPGTPAFVPFDEEFMQPTEPDYDTEDLHRWLASRVGSTRANDSAPSLLGGDEWCRDRRCDGHLTRAASVSAHKNCASAVARKS
jgi:DNA-directed RNA polymerase specialized sigma24 family protein